MTGVSVTRGGQRRRRVGQRRGKSEKYKYVSEDQNMVQLLEKIIILSIILKLDKSQKKNHLF